MYTYDLVIFYVCRICCFSIVTRFFGQTYNSFLIWEKQRFTFAKYTKLRSYNQTEKKKISLCFHPCSTDFKYSFCVEVVSFIKVNRRSYNAWFRSNYWEKIINVFRV